VSTLLVKNALEGICVLHLHHAFWKRAGRELDASGDSADRAR